MPRLGIALLAYVAFGCASVPPGPQSGRVVSGRPVSSVFASALEALVALGANPVGARPRERGGVLRALVRTTGLPHRTFVLEVTVLGSDEEVRVAVTAEPAGAGQSALDGLVATTEGSAPRSGCGCPGQEPLGDTHPHDNLGALSQSRRLVRTYLAILDDYLR